MIRKFIEDKIINPSLKKKVLQHWEYNIACAKALTKAFGGHTKVQAVSVFLCMQGVSITSSACAYCKRYRKNNKCYRCPVLNKGMFHRCSIVPYLDVVKAIDEGTLNDFISASEKFLDFLKDT